MSYDWEDTKDIKVSYCCQNCGRNNNQGAQFQYHEQGVKTPEGLKKLPMRCIECWDTLKQQTGIPYMWLDVWVTAEQTYEFYLRKAEKLGGNIEHAKEYKLEVLKAYIKSCDSSYGQKMSGKIDEAEYLSQCSQHPRELIENIAKTTGLSSSQLSTGGYGFKKID